MSYQTGDTARITGTFRDEDGNLVNPSTVTFTYRDPAGTETQLVYGDDSARVVRPSTGTFYVDVDLDAVGRWAWSWDADGTAAGTDVGSLFVTGSDLETSPAPRFASTSDLAALLAVEFTAAQETQAALLLDLATSAIIQAVDKTDEWALALTAIPGQLRLLCLTVARRVMLNASGVRSQSEGLGSYQHTETYADVTAGIDLTPQERMLARRCVYGTNTASVRVGSIIDDCYVHEFYESVELDGDEDCS